MNARKITLVIPPSPFLLDERVFVSLGILKVAAVLEQAGHAVNVLDLSGISNYLDALKDYLKDADIEILGLTATTPQMPSAFRIAEEARKVRPDIRLILGGPHATMANAAVTYAAKHNRTEFRGKSALKKLHQAFDTIVAGDGEFAIFKAIEEGAPAIVDADDNRSPLFMSNADYDASPLPARHLVAMESYKYGIEGHKATSLIAQLGCPFNCGFCGGRYSKSLRVVRTRTIESIIAEIEYLYREYGYTGFMFYDDELNVNKYMIDLMCQLRDLQDRLGVDMRFRGFVKAELFTDEQAYHMYQAGFRWLLTGFEAADERILKNIEKRATLEDNTRAVEFAKKHDLKVKALMSIGHPGENERSTQAIADWLVKMDVEDFDCTIITTFPGTPYFDLAEPHATEKGVWTYTHPKSGDRLHAYELDYTETADYYKGDPEDGYTAYVFTDYLSAEELVAHRNNIENEVRHTLGIPFYPRTESLNYEHSMGQGFASHILKTSTASTRAPENK